MSGWTSEQLSAVGDAEELRIAGRRADGTLRKSTIIWAVRATDDLFVRSVNGPSIHAAKKATATRSPTRNRCKEEPARDGAQPIPAPRFH